MRVGVTGSIAFDHIMSFDGEFKDHILPDKIHTLNVSFLVDGFEKRRGGCAPNIAYACALHGLPAGIIGSVGSDFAEYAAWLSERNVDVSGVTVHPDLVTASCFITTDRANNQITGFYPGAMARAIDVKLAELNQRPEIIVVSPNDPGAMAAYPEQCRELGIPFLYDPGQQVIALDSDALRAGLQGAKLLVANDYELATVQKKLGTDVNGLLEFCELVVVTLGAQGSRIHNRGGDAIEIPVAKVKEAVDPTGCGDAYRGGFLHGLLNGASLEVAGRIGSLTAGYCVEVKGTSEYRFDAEGFGQRYEESFGEALSSLAAG